MTNFNVAHQRLYNQSVALTAFEKPGDVVKSLGAVQAQDYLGALRKTKVLVSFAPFDPLSPAQLAATAAAAEPYGRFLGLPVEIKW